MALLGLYEHSLDSKKRLTIPAKFRNFFTEHKVFISLGFDGCLDLRNEEEWNKWTEKLGSTGQATAESRALTRKIMSMSDETTFDSVGRIKIPQILQKKINLNKEVLIIGNNNHLEIWNPDRWTQYLEEEAPELEKAAEAFAEKL